MSDYLIDGGSHIDVPLTNLAVSAFNADGDFIGGQLFPTVPVGKQSDGYYIINPDMFLRVPDTTRSPMTAPKMGDWDVSTNTYFCKNYAFGKMTAKETLGNADMAIRIRETSQRFVTGVLLRDKEQRIFNLVGSISNVGSGVALTGGDKFSDPVNSDPIAVVNTGSAFIESRTGFKPNVLAMDKDTRKILRFHPALRDFMKYTAAGPIPDAMLAELFDVDRILVARGIYNPALEGATGSRANIWGNTMVLAKVDPGTIGLQTETFGVSMEWTPEGFPAAMAVERYDHHDRGRKAEIIAAQYFADEKIVATDFAYTVTGTL